ncbi:MAG: calcium-binding protein [Pseudomonadota bacterium]
MLGNTSDGIAFLNNVFNGSLFSEFTPSNLKSQIKAVSNQLQANNVALAGAVDQPGHAPALAKVNSAISKAQEAAELADIFTVTGEPRSVVGGLADFLTKWREAGRLMDAAAGELGDSNPAGLGLKALGSMLDLITSVVSDEALEALNALDKILLRDPPKGEFAGIDASDPEGRACLEEMRDALAEQLRQVPNIQQPDAGWDLTSPTDDISPPNPVSRVLSWLFDPLVVDLDGDGVELTARGAPPVTFDFGEGGTRYQTSWVSPDDGIVVRDVNGNGLVDDASEFFGNATVDAFTDIAGFDDNGDGVINFEDSVWAEMAVWRDLNQDGRTQDGELISMADAGMARINLDRAETDFEVAGATVAATGSWTGVDGLERDAWAVFLNVTTGASDVPLPDGVEVTDAIRALPYLAGGGKVPDLWKAMALDPNLEAMVRDYSDGASTMSGVELWEGMAAIVVRWLAGGGSGDFDWKEDILSLDNPREALEPLLEEFFDTDIVLAEPASIRDIGISFTEDVWTEFNFRNFVDATLVRFVSQIPAYARAQAETPEEIAATDFNPFRPVEDGVLYDPDTDSVQSGFYSFLNAVINSLPNDRSDALEVIDRLAPTLRAQRAEQYQETRPAWFPHVEFSAYRNDLRQWLNEAEQSGRLDPWVSDFLFYRVLAEYWGEGGDGDDVLDPMRTKYGDATGRDYTYFDGGLGDDTLISAPYSGPIIPYLPLGGRNIEVTGSQNRTLIVYREGDGDDIVDMNAATGQHMVFLPDIASTDAVFRVSPEGGGDFLLTFANGGSITFKGLGNVTNGGLEIRYADNVVQDEDDVRLQYTDFADIVVGDPGDNVVTGGPGDDLLRGDSGDDLYIYRRGDGHDAIEEVYETVLDTSSGQILRASNQLWLQDFEKSEVRFSRESENQNSAEFRNMLITFDGAPDDSIIIVNQFRVSSFGATPQPRLDLIRFADGSTIDFAEASEFLFASLVGDGDDVAEGSNTNDVLVFSAGNDTLSGNGGDDVYIRNAGTPGDDVIDEDGGTGDVETLVLFGLTPADVILTREGNDVLLTLPLGSVRIVSQLGTGGQHRVEEVRFVPVTADIDNPSAVWTAVDIAAALNPADAIDTLLEGTSDPETLNGNGTDQILDGKEGNDILQGRFGSDIYLWRPGDGNDEIRENGELDSRSVDRIQLLGLNPDDVLLARIPGNELTITQVATGEVLTVINHFSGPKSAIEFLVFEDGTVWGPDDIQAAAWWRGTAGNDDITASGLGETIEGGAGDDMLEGRQGGDLYRVGVGSGSDTIIDRTYGGTDANTLDFSGVGPAELEITRDGASGSGLDALVRFGPNDVVRLVGQFDPDPEQRPIQFFSFNGASVQPTDAFFDTELVVGTPGNDIVRGTQGADIVDALAGNDDIQASGGDDIYLWGAGRGNDTLRENGDGAPSNGVRLIGLNREDIALGRQPDSEDLEITILSTGEVMTVIDQFGPFGSSSAGTRFFGIERIEFADGTEMNREEILIAAPLAVDAASGTVSGRRGEDAYIWGPGRGEGFIDDDGLRKEGDILVLDGLLPDDIVFRRGAADDALDRYALKIEILSTGEVLTLLLQLRGDDLSATSFGDPIPTIVFADGTRLDTASLSFDLPFLGTAAAEEIYGDEVANQIQGAGGNDTLRGQEGGDRYIWTPGDGDDVIRELTTELVPGDGGEEEEGGGTEIEVPLESDGDSLRLVGVVATQVTFERDPATPFDLLVRIGAETIRVERHFESPLAGLESVETDDAVIPAWQINELVGPNNVAGGIGPDELVGTWAADLFLPGAGDDMIRTLGGPDRIVLAADGGRDSIEGFVGGPFGTRIELPASAFEDFESLLAAAFQDGEDVVIPLDGGPSSSPMQTLASPAHALVLKNTQLSDLEPENFGFDRPPILGTDESETVVGTPLDDDIQAGAGDDTIRPFGGDDDVDAGAGDDHIVLTSGIHTIDGGEDEDVVEVSGNRADYEIVETADGYRLAPIAPATGPLADLSGVEKILFDDGLFDLIPANRPPVAEDDLFEISEDSPTALDFLANDTDPDADPLVAEIVAGPASGTLTFQDGVWTYTPGPDVFGPDSFTYAAVDAEGARSEEAVVSIAVLPLNDAPVFEASGPFVIEENGVGAGIVEASDVDGTDLIFSIAGGDDGSLFEIDAETGALSFKAAPDFEQPEDVDGDNIYSVDVRVSDGDLSAVTTIGVTVTDVDEAPVPIALDGTSGRDNLVGTDAAEAIRSFGGSYDRMFGGDGADQFIFGSETSNGRRERDLIQDYEVGKDSIVLEEGAAIASIRATSSQVIIFLEGDRDVIYVRGDGVTADNLTVTIQDHFDIA